MYGFGYYFGLDVYDVGEYIQQGNLWLFELGMVIMVELGLYVFNEFDIVELFCGIGICIEDNLVIIVIGNEVFINGVLKSIYDIEVLME